MIHISFQCIPICGSVLVDIYFSVACKTPISCGGVRKCNHVKQFGDTPGQGRSSSFQLLVHAVVGGMYGIHAYFSTFTHVCHEITFCDVWNNFMNNDELCIKILWENWCHIVQNPLHGLFCSWERWLECGVICWSGVDVWNTDSEKWEIIWEVDVVVWFRMMKGDSESDGVCRRLHTSINEKAWFGWSTPPLKPAWPGRTGQDRTVVAGLFQKWGLVSSTVPHAIFVLFPFFLSKPFQILVFSKWRQDAHVQCWFASRKVAGFSWLTGTSSP